MVAGEGRGKPAKSNRFRTGGRLDERAPGSLLGGVMICDRCGHREATTGGTCSRCNHRPKGFGAGSSRHRLVYEKPTFAAGDRIGNRFEVLAAVTSGPLGWLYDCFDRDYEVDVTVRVLSSRLLQTETERESVIRAIRELRRLRHPGLARYYECGEADGRVFIALQPADGPTLRRLLLERRQKGERFSEEEVRRLAAPIASALDHLHRFSAHGCLTADGVQLVGGEPRLTDYGIAGALPRAPLVAALRAAGLRHVIAPEVMRGSGSGPASDVYALASLVLELLTGAPLAEDAPALGDACAGLAPGAAKLLSSALSSAPAERPDTASALVTGLFGGAVPAPSAPVPVSAVLAAGLADKRRPPPPEEATRPPAGQDEVDEESLEEDPDFVTAEGEPTVKAAFPFGPMGLQSGAEERETGDTDPPPPPGHEDTPVDHRLEPDAPLASGHESIVYDDEDDITPVAAHEATRVDLRPLALERDDGAARQPGAKAGSRWPVAAAAALVLTIVGVFVAFAVQGTREESTRSAEAAAPVAVAEEEPDPAEPEDATVLVEAEDPAELVAAAPAREEKLVPKPSPVKEASGGEDARRRQQAAAIAALGDGKPPAVPASDGPCPSGMVLVPGGAFRFGAGSDDDLKNFGDIDARLERVESFCIDTYEHPNRSRSRPSVNVTWTQADQACRKEGKRLCTEVEWERACKGPANRRFPYGRDFDADACNAATEAGEARRVVTAGAFRRCRSGFGVFDLSGNVAEWTADLYEPGFSDRVARGGASDRPGWDTRCASRAAKAPGTREPLLGFRCCADSK